MYPSKEACGFTVAAQQQQRAGQLHTLLTLRLHWCAAWQERRFVGGRHSATSVVRCATRGRRSGLPGDSHGGFWPGFLYSMVANERGLPGLQQGQAAGLLARFACLLCGCVGGWGPWGKAHLHLHRGSEVKRGEGSRNFHRYFNVYAGVCLAFAFVRRLPRQLLHPPLSAALALAGPVPLRAVIDRFRPGTFSRAVVVAWSDLECPHHIVFASTGIDFESGFRCQGAWRGHRELHGRVVGDVRSTQR